MSLFAIFLATGLSAATLQGDGQAAAPSVAQQAVRAFESVCLANRTAGADAALNAMRSFPGASPMPDLPYQRTTLKILTSGPLEFLMRPDRRGFGCFVAFPGGDGESLEAVTALNAVEGLSARAPGNNRRRSHEWDVAGSSDRIYLTPGSERGGVLINLEVRGQR